MVAVESKGRRLQTLVKREVNQLRPPPILLSSYLQESMEVSLNRDRWPRARLTDRSTLQQQFLPMWLAPTRKRIRRSSTNCLWKSISWVILFIFFLETVLNYFSNQHKEFEFTLYWQFLNCMWIWIFTLFKSSPMCLWIFEIMKRQLPVI